MDILKINPADLVSHKKSRLIAAAIFAFIPFTGIIGIHDFMVGRKRAGIIHLAISLIDYAISPFILMILPLPLRTSSTIAVTASLIMYAPIIASYIWGVTEGISIVKTVKNANIAPSGLVSNDPQNTREPVQTKHANATYSIWSAVTASFAVALWTAFLVSYINIDPHDSGQGALIIFIVPALPLGLLSIILALFGLKTKYKTISIITLLVYFIAVVGTIIVFNIKS